MKDKLKRFLSERRKVPNPDRTLRPSAVLVLIFEKQGEYYVLFTKRTDRVEVHKGEISFPGGACDKEDKTPLDTALREGFEEIGLAPADVEVLGELDDCPTIGTRYIIAPFVAAIPFPYEFEPCVEEVGAIIGIPIRELLDQACVTKEMQDWGGRMVMSYSYHYEDEVIWGATARILRQFLDIWKDLEAT